MDFVLQEETGKRKRSERGNGTQSGCKRPGEDRCVYIIRSMDGGETLKTRVIGIVIDLIGGVAVLVGRE